MPAGLSGGLDHAGAGRPWAGRGLAGGAGWVSGSGGGLEGDGVAERFELVDEPAGAVLNRVAAGEPVGAEFAEGDALADDVVVGDEDVVAGGADRFCVAAAAADLPVVGGEVGVLAAGGGAGGLGQRLAQPAVAVAGLAGAASAAGGVEAGADGRPGDEVLGASEDAHVEAALGDQHAGGVDADAGDRAEQLDELGVGLGGSRDAGVERGDRLVERVDVGEQAGDATLESLIPASWSTFSSRWIARVRSSTWATQSRVRSRSRRISGGGTKLGRTSPCSSSWQHQAESITSLLRPGTLCRC